MPNSINHLDLMMTVASLVAEPGDVGHIIRRSLEVLCRTNNWAMGQFWIARSKENIIDCSEWYFASAVLAQLRIDSTDRRISKGVCLPGRIWSNGLFVAISDLENETGLSFTRKAAVAKHGIVSACGFPLKNGPFITGVYEFFSFERMVFSEADTRFYEQLGTYLATIIAQREADHALRQQEALNRAVLNHAYNAFIAISETSLITEWSSRACDLFGWEKDEVIGKPLAEIIIPERYRDAHMKGLFRYMTTKEGPVLNKPVQAPALRKDGTEIPVQLLIFPIEGLDVKRFGAFIVDLSKPQEEAQIKLE